jgi:protochlorophyllide reductase
MFALELEARQQEQGGGIRSLAAHPGLARTDLQPTAIASGGNRLEAVAYRLMDPLFQSAAMGALPQLHAATAATAQGGEHYGPDQLGGMRGHPTRCRIAPAALDREQRQRLWQLSEELAGGLLMP